jgi:hypothetical protein
VIDLAEVRSLELVTPKTVDEASRVLARWLAEKSRALREASAEGALDLGSRFAYRMWGASRRGQAKLPMRLTWRVSGSGSGSTVALRMRSNEGRYLVRTYQHHLIYERTFDQLVRELHAVFA